ncbi:MAG: hypothetical protein HRU29_03530 [Rhizobiales bacterium]|nr:hypothetical protein [Hyphomicrobiales bacterium]NRB13450.1 hypothetical protein [Hyphomicrobiales bacterium]
MVFVGSVSAAMPALAANDVCAQPPMAEILPELVINMRQDIIRAAKTGDMEQMQYVVEQNEVLPIAKFNAAQDANNSPLVAWQAQSQDTDGLYILAQMIEILNLGFAKQALIAGVDLYTWPYFADQDISQLCPTELVDLLTISSPQAVKQMQQIRLYTGFQLAIGSDGSWHYFARKNIVINK